MKAFIVGRVSLVETKQREGKTPLVTVYVQQPKETIKLYTSQADLAQWSPANDLEIDGPKYSIPVEIRADVYNGKASMMVLLDGPIAEVTERRTVEAAGASS